MQERNLCSQGTLQTVLPNRSGYHGKIIGKQISKHTCLVMLIQVCWNACKNIAIFEVYTTLRDRLMRGLSCLPSKAIFL